MQAPGSQQRSEEFSLVVSATLGAGFFGLSLLWVPFVFDRGFIQWLEFGIVVLVMYVASLHFFDPLQNLLTKLFTGRSYRDEAHVRSRSLRVLLLGVILSLAFGEHVIVEMLLKYPASLLGLLGSFLTVGLTTFIWIRGVRCKPPRAAWWSAALYGISSEAIAVCVLTLQLSRHWSPIDEPTVNSFAAYLVKNSVAGFLAGWIIDRNLGIYRGIGACVGLLVGLILFDALASALGAAAIQSVLSEIALAAGWALGLMICRFADHLLTPRNALTYRA